MDQTETVKSRLARLLAADPLLSPYGGVIERRIKRLIETEKRLLPENTSLSDFASGHEFFGLHFRDGGWVFREWAQNAMSVFLVGEFSGWQPLAAYALGRINREGVWEIRLPENALKHGDLYRLHVRFPGGSGDRIPAWARRVVYDEKTEIGNAQVWRPDQPYVFMHPRPEKAPSPFLVYEAHAGMAQEEPRCGTYREFADRIIPRIVKAGYNAIQLMAVAEHPYYASFGYQVGSFFAPSSRFGPPEDFKYLVDTAHGAGLYVLMDLVHSHAVPNVVEGLALFDGTPVQYFHKGPRGVHPAWGSMCFDYAKPQVLHFLLSNCRYWLDEFNVDGFRFDGVTSMAYLHHGLGVDFLDYSQYFDGQEDEDALCYLALANELIHSVNPQAITIAEDVSGLPGLAVPVENGGYGFDCRFAMGVPDYWIKLVKDVPDEDWPMGHIWFELTNRRQDEKTISYAECHDQALVGDQTLIFRLVGGEMYHYMSVLRQGSFKVSRGIALHKMIRLITLFCAGHGYLNFMGNEFGHPEWIDFPRAGNGFSYAYARRQWSLADDPLLLYGFLAAFDRQMIALAKTSGVPDGEWPFLLHLDEGTKILAFERAGLILAFNFHPDNSRTDYWIPASPGSYRQVLSTDDKRFGGHGLIEPDQTHHTITDRIHRHFLSLYLPARTAVVLEKIV
ncbi:MAG: alpha amylase C-terminal domain-containing protein [Deltaproteobacteria bacterium]|nr:alpha amylase C-terminal domain-containing protein [Deltaproteobacteria bacterium]